MTSDQILQMIRCTSEAYRAGTHCATMAVPASTGAAADRELGEMAQTPQFWQGVMDRGATIRLAGTGETARPEVKLTAHRSIITALYRFLGRPAASRPHPTQVLEIGEDAQAIVRMIWPDNPPHHDPVGGLYVLPAGRSKGVREVLEWKR